MSRCWSDLPAAWAPLAPLSGDGGPQARVDQELDGRSRERFGGNEGRLAAPLARRSLGEAMLVAHRLVLPHDGEPRVDGRDHVRDIAHVGAPRPDPVIALARCAAERLEVRPEAPCQVQVVDHVAVALPRAQRHLYVACHRRGARAPFHDGAHPPELDAVSGADVELAGRTLGDDVDGLATVGDVSVHAHAVAKVHPLPVHEAKRVQARGERTAADMGGEGGMGGLSVKCEPEPCGGQCVVREEVPVERVEHHCDVDALERPGLDHLDLAAPPFLGGSAQEHDLTPRGLGHGGSGDEGADSPGRDEVVPTGVTDPRKRVVFGENRDARPTSEASACAESRGHTGDAELHAVPAGRQELAQPPARLVLLEAQLGVRMDAPRE
jgi:hypothetical protein